MQIRQIGIALAAAFERRRRYYMIRAELEACSPRVLADLGIARDDVKNIAWSAAARKVAERFGRRPARAANTAVPQMALSSRGVG